MLDVPSFSSFPELDQINAGPRESDSLGESSRSVRHDVSRGELADKEPTSLGGSVEPPSFLSFPDLDLVSSSSKRRDKDDGRREGERVIDRERDDRRKRPRSRERRHDDGDRRRKRSRSRDDKDDRKHQRPEGERERHTSDQDRYRSWKERKDEDQRRKRSTSREEERRKDKRSDRHRHRDEDAKLKKDKEEKRRREREAAERLVNKSAAEKDDSAAWYESSVTTRSISEPVTSSDFFPDRYGDKDALRYNAASSLNPPKYRRDGGGRILGLNNGIRIVYSNDRTEKGVELAPRGRPYIPRYSARTLEGSAHHVLVRPAISGEFNPNAGFIDFGTRKKDEEEEDLPEYRSISRQRGAEDSVEIEAGLGTFATLEQDVRRRTAETERHIQSDPQDHDAWVTYSTLHLKLSSTVRDPSVDPLTLPQNRASAEVTLSILSRALDAHPQNFLSTKLHLAYLRAASAFWPVDKVTSRWKNVLRELGEKHGTKGLEEEMTSLWLGYIEWREGQGFGKGKNAGGVDEVVEVYAECMEKLGSGSIGADPHREDNQLYLFLRACTFMRQAGYTERALATFQALVELTFFKPDHLRLPAHATPEWLEGVLEEFEQFWDAESPRIGEPHAKGWKNDLEEQVPTPDHVDFVPTLEDPFEKWLEAERFADDRFNLPGRAKNLDDDEDPYRVVLFQDVRPFLFIVRDPRVRLQLVYAFLAFLGLPFNPPGVGSDSLLAKDPYFRSSIAYGSSARAAFWPPKLGARRIPWQTVGGEPMTPEVPSALEDPFGCPVKSWAQQRSTMFAPKGQWFSDFDPSELVNVNLIREAFQLLRPIVPDPEFTLAYFAFEFRVSPKAAIKSAKASLSEDRENLVLWDGYARLERQRRNVTVARSVYATALQAAKESEDKTSTWASWAEMEFEEDEARCLQVLLMACGLEVIDGSLAPKTPSAITMLKARQRYASFTAPFTVEQLVLSGLFTYLADGVDALRALVSTYIDAVGAATAQAEQAHQTLLHVLHVHSTRNGAPRSLLRDALEKAMSSFKSNTLFLSLYLFGELHSRVYGRVQRLIAGISGDVVGLLWAVWAESMSSHRTFWDKGGGGAERVRFALDKAVGVGQGRHSVSLWRLYVEFEVLMGRFAAAKKLCYRAVAAVGGCKELYLLPFTPTLRPHFTPREMREWAELVVERGVRLRIPFETYFDVEIGEDALTLPEDEELEDDELAFLSKREELKPY